MDLAALVRNIPDFPKPGIQFKDITTLLQHGPALKYIIDGWKKRYSALEIDAIVGMEARGFIFGAPLAYAMELPFVPIRKKNKLPARKIHATYELEYGTDTLEMHADALQPGQRVVLIDDLLATGGTLYAMVDLIRQLGADVVEAAFVIELSFLDARSKVKGLNIHSLIEMTE